VIGVELLTRYGHITLTPQNSGPLYSNTVIGTLAVDGWAVTFSTARRGLGRLGPAHSLLAVPNVTAHPSTASLPTSYYLMWHYNCLLTLKGQLCWSSGNNAINPHIKLSFVSGYLHCWKLVPSYPSLQLSLDVYCMLKMSL